MAEQLEPTGEFDIYRRYPWDEWLDGRPRRLVWGEDFLPEPAVFANYAYARARDRGLRVAICKEPTDCVVIQSYKWGQAKPVLPSPYRRLPNGRIDKTAPSRGADTLTKPERDPERECRICGKRLTPASIAAGRCMRVDLSAGAMLVEACP